MSAHFITPELTLSGPDLPAGSAGDPILGTASSGTPFFQTRQMRIRGRSRSGDLAKRGSPHGIVVEPACGCSGAGGFVRCNAVMRPNPPVDRVTAGPSETLESVASDTPGLWQGWGAVHGIGAFAMRS